MHRGSQVNRLLLLVPSAGSVAHGPRPAQIRRLLQVYSGFRWGGGFAVLALAALSVPGRSQVALAGLILWVAAYNGVTTYALPRLADHSLVSLTRVLGLLDFVSYFGLLTIYGSSAPGALYACYAALLIPAVAFDRTLGALVAAAAFVVGLAALDLSRLALLGDRFPIADFLLWSAVTVILATSLAITQHLLAEVAVPAPEPEPADEQQPPRLSPRELEVLRLVAAGYSNVMIANRLHLSENTVKGYVESLLLRLHCRNRAEAVAAASRLGLI